MADLEDMLHEFGHMVEELQRQQAEQRTEQRRDQEAEVETDHHREDHGATQSRGAAYLDVSVQKTFAKLLRNLQCYGCKVKKAKLW